MGRQCKWIANASFVDVEKYVTQTWSDNIS